MNLQSYTAHQRPWWRSLRGKTLVALGLVCVLVLLPACAIGWYALNQMRVHVAHAYGSNLTQLNRYRLMAPIISDVALSQRLADADVTRTWLLDEDSAQNKARFFREAEGYRAHLRDRAYFIASALSGNYYFSDDSAEPATTPRYQLTPNDPEDTWFYHALSNTAPYQLNVNTDATLKISRVWINTVIRDDQARPIGLVGASLDLTGFLRTFVDHQPAGVTPMVINADGAIQAHPDPTRIAFNVAVEGARAPHSVFADLPQHDATRLYATMSDARQTPEAVHTVSLDTQDGLQLVSLSYMPELDWYMATSIDPSVAHLLRPGWLWGAAAALLIIIVALLAGVAYGVERIVLRPLRQLRVSVQGLSDGRYRMHRETVADDEIGDLAQAFDTMATKIRQHTQELEHQVAARTAQLEDANKRMAQAQAKVEASIDYASLIQRVILPERQIRQFFGDDCFVIWQPRDTVGGDFYLFHQDKNNFLLGLIDCAGHGVPGALMTMMARAALDAALHAQGPRDPAAILTQANTVIGKMLAGSGIPRAVAVNTDVALLYVDRNTQQASYCGARINLYACDGKQVFEYPAIKRSLGDKRQLPFINTTIRLHQSMDFYLCSDGILDQAGGKHGFGFGEHRLRQTIVNNALRPMPEQASAIMDEITRYRGALPQRDDITLVSFRYNHGDQRDSG